MKTTITSCQPRLIHFQELSAEIQRRILEKHASLNALPQTDIQADAQSLKEMDTSCCLSDTYSTQTPDNKIHFPEKHPQSIFETFCAERKIDLLTLDKKGQKRTARYFAEYLNQLRRRIDGRKIPLCQVYADVRDYIEWKLSAFCN